MPAGTSSASETTSARAVRVPCPTSALPVKACTPPSTPICTHAPPFGGFHPLAPPPSGRAGSRLTIPAPKSSKYSRSEAGVRSHGRRGRPRGFTVPPAPDARPPARSPDGS